MSPRPVVERHRYDKTCPCRACLETHLRIQRSLYGEQDPLAAARGIFNCLCITAVVALVVLLLALVEGWITWSPVS